jgi:hypothetical protein
VCIVCIKPITMDRKGKQKNPTFSKTLQKEILIGKNVLALFFFRPNFQPKTSRSEKQFTQCFRKH